MAQAFIANYVHIAFSTKQRAATLTSDPDRIWSYLAGIARGTGMIPMAVNGHVDHVHLLLALPSERSVAKAVNLLKSNSSKWMNQQKRGFAWQRGYGAFSVSKSKLAVVTRYIENQQEHHRKRSFESEFIALLDAHGVNYDPRYVFD
jgi:putative transposase